MSFSNNYTPSDAVLVTAGPGAVNLVAIQATTAGTITVSTGAGSGGIVIPIAASQIIPLQIVAVTASAGTGQLIGYKA